MTAQNSAPPVLGRPLARLVAFLVAKAIRRGTYQVVALRSIGGLSVLQTESPSGLIASGAVFVPAN
jgi:hypothetical protein